MHVNEPAFVVLADGRRIAYDEVRPADPKGTALLLTGAESNRLAWYKQRDTFGRVFRTIALDYRDTGDSDPVREPYTIADLADDAALVLTSLAIPRTHVIGVSLGGYVALELALRHPERVERLALVSTSATYIPASPDLLDMLAQAQRLVAGGGQKQQSARDSVLDSEHLGRALSLVTAPGYLERHPDDWEQLARCARYRPLSQEAAARQMQACLTYDVSGRLGDIHAPTLVVHGALDARVDPEHGRLLAQRIHGARFLLYPDTGHLAHIERADEFNRDVLTFLAA